MSETGAGEGAVAEMVEAALYSWWHGAGKLKEQSPQAHCHDAAVRVAQVLADAGVTDHLLAQDHEVEFDDDGWALQHTIGCRPDLLACTMDDRMREEVGGPPEGYEDGVRRWRVWVVDGELEFEPAETT